MIADWQPIVTLLMEAAASLLAATISALIIKYFPRAIAAWEAWTSTIVSEHARVVLLGAAQTAAGILEAKLAQGALKLVDLRVDNPEVIKQAERALARVPDAAAIAKKDLRSMAETTLGQVRAAAVVVPVSQ